MGWDDRPLRAKAEGKKATLGCMRSRPGEPGWWEGGIDGLRVIVIRAVRIWTQCRSTDGRHKGFSFVSYNQQELIRFSMTVCLRGEHRKMEGVTEEQGEGGEGRGTLGRGSGAVDHLI